MGIKSIAHVCIKTGDLKRTSDFYCETLGFEKVFNFIRDDEVIGFYLKADNETFIEVFLTTETSPANSQPVLNHFCLETDSIEKLRERLIERGYEPRELIMGADNALQFWVQDPNGLEIEFQQYTKQSSQFTGSDVKLT